MLNKCSTSLSMQEMKIQTALRLHLTEWLIYDSDRLCWQACRIRGNARPLFEQVCITSMEITMAVPHKTKKNITHDPDITHLVTYPNDSLY